MRRFSGSSIFDPTFFFLGWGGESKVGILRIIHLDIMRFGGGPLVDARAA